MKPSDIVFTPLAVSLVAFGVIITGAGLFMMVPLKFDKSWCWSNLPLVGMLAIIGYFILIAPTAGREVASAARVTVFTTSRMYTMLILLFTVMGTSGVLGRLYQTQIEKAFGTHPLWIAFVGGFGVPTPNSVTPLIQTLWANEALRIGLMYFVQVNGVLSISLFHLRVAGFLPGSVIPAEIYRTSIVLAVFMLPLIKPAMVISDYALALMKR